MEVFASVGALLFASVFHEYTHKWTANALGYTGYFTWGRPFLKYFKNPGLKIENIRYNRVCVKDLIIIRLASCFSIPFFGLAFYILYPNMISYSIGLIVGLLASGVDIYDAYEFRKWWL